MKLIILYENKQWMPPITDALNKKEIPFELWHIEDLPYIDVTVPPPEGVFFNRMSPSAHHRGSLHFVEHTCEILHWLEQANCRVINPSPLWRLEVSKWQQYQLLNRSGVRTPKTIAAFNQKSILSAARMLGYPVILKHNCGGKGLGVIKFDSDKTLSNYLCSSSYQASPDGIILVQQYIVTSEPYIVRAEFIAGQFTYAVKVNTEHGFELCPADSCAAQEQFCPTLDNNRFSIIRDFNHPVISSYLKLVHQLNIDVAGIEMIFDKDQLPYTYDINFNTNYNQKAEQKAGVSNYDLLAGFLANTLAQQKS